MAKQRTKVAKVENVTNPFVEDWKGRVAQTCPPVVKVTWKDACVDTSITLDTNPGWADRWHSGVVMQTLGYLLKHNEHWVTIGMERHAEVNSGYRRIQDIPTYSVCELKVLEPEVK